MADEKNKKDEIEENLDQETGDIHEADDTFGLPDIDFDPVTPDEPAKEEPETEPEESATEPVYEATDPEPAEELTIPESTEEVDHPYMYASGPGDGDDNPSETHSDNSFSDSTGEDSTMITEETVYHSTESEEVERDYSTSVEPEPEVEEKSAYVPGSYSDRRESSGNAGIIIGVLLVLILAIAGVWYFVWYQPAQEAESQRIAQEQQEQADQAAREAEAEAERQAAEAAAARRAEEEAAAAEEEAEPETGTIETISQRTGRYYVVVASAVDGDLAMDYANRLSEEGRNVKLIAPYGSVIFHRVTIQDLDTWAEAQNAANELKADYGDGVWVKKY